MHIYQITNKKDAKLLRKKVAAFDFAKFSKKEVNGLVQDMKAIMRQANGIGLSANQIGLDLSVFVAEVEDKFYAVFNPKITKASDEIIDFEEGCLSVLNKYGTVPRPERITLEGQDKNGKKLKIKAWGLLARVFQHEEDHLNGKLFIDKAKDIHDISTEKLT